MNDLQDNFIEKSEQRGREKERQEIITKIKSLMTDERKVSVFGKGMDSWEAITYDEKMLVNSVLKEVIKILTPLS